jgi:hypothetical protein
MLSLARIIVSKLVTVSATSRVSITLREHNLLEVRCRPKPNHYSKTHFLKVREQFGPSATSRVNCDRIELARAESPACAMDHARRHIQKPKVAGRAFNSTSAVMNQLVSP